AGIIAMMPQCMIFDESTAMLDPEGRRKVLDTMELLNRERGITIINITHYMDEAARASRVIVLNDGEILMDAPPKEIFSRPEQLRQVGLDVPQHVRVAELLAKEGIDIPGDIYTMEGCADAIAQLYREKTDSQ
ncbi:MAG: energy-coupling factor transporter ATPase, partial [Clostridia bacterium]|nr:energy-coupling factor transporter ATPase [Clostridia bacterium]